MHDIPETCVAFLRSLDRPRGRPIRSGYAGSKPAHDMFWELSCRSYGWVKIAGERLLLTSAGRAILRTAQSETTLFESVPSIMHGLTASWLSNPSGMLSQ